MFVEKKQGIINGESSGNDYDQFIDFDLFTSIMVYFLLFQSLTESDLDLPITIKLLLSSFVMIFFVFVIIILRNLSFMIVRILIRLHFYLFRLYFLQTFLSEINKVILKIFNSKSLKDLLSVV